MSYALIAVPAYELPLSLLEQKREYDVDAFLASATEHPDRIFAYVIERDEEEIACFWAYHAKLYGSIGVDTLVVDEAVRDDDTVRDVLRIAKSVLKGLAEELGAKKITWSAHPKVAERMVKFLDDPQVSIAEWVIMIDLTKEVDDVSVDVDGRGEQHERGSSEHGAVDADPVPVAGTGGTG
jgi:hypothetical protein